MPELAVVDLEARVVAVVDAHRPELLALVDRELDRQLDQLDVERIAARNGTPLCTRCGAERE